MVETTTSCREGSDCRAADPPVPTKRFHNRLNQLTGTTKITVAQILGVDLIGDSAQLFTDFIKIGGTFINFRDLVCQFCLLSQESRGQTGSIARKVGGRPHDNRCCHNDRSSVFDKCAPPS